MITLLYFGQLFLETFDKPEESSGASNKHSTVEAERIVLLCSERSKRSNCLKIQEKGFPVVSRSFQTGSPNACKITVQLSHRRHMQARHNQTDPSASEVQYS